MPELPEVETVRRGLEPVLAHARLIHIEARRPDLRFPLPPGFVQRLKGARINSLERRGKYILSHLDREETLIIHLGMTGRFEIDRKSEVSAPGEFVRAARADPKHAHIVFHTDGGARVTYFDARRFGFMDISATPTLGEHPRFVSMGPEPFGEAFSADYLARVFKGRRQGAKTLLLDQSIVAGLGNIYVCEALHRAGISPKRAADDISPRKLAGLVQSIRLVLDEAIIAGGSTLRDFVGADGALGYFQHRFKAYGRAGEACGARNCTGVIERFIQSGRSTFHCPVCQR